MELGVGAFKFQTVISNEMRITKDPSHKTRIRSQSRRSIQEKCKREYQNGKKKVSSKNEVHTEIHEDESSSENDEFQLLEHKKKKEKEFILQVSNSSSSDSFDSDAPALLQYEKHMSPIGFYEEENMMASQNLKTLTSTYNKTLQSQNTLQLANKNSTFIQKQKKLKAFRPMIIKKEIQLLRGLKQNQDFVNKEDILNEYKVDKEICVDMDCQDIKTFMRLQNEVEEMRRKQMDFNKQKERHYEVIKRKPHIHESTIMKNQDDNKLWTVLMAKRFIKNMKLKKESDPQVKILRKSTRGSQLKTQS